MSLVVLTDCTRRLSSCSSAPYSVHVVPNYLSKGTLVVDDDYYISFLSNSHALIGRFAYSGPIRRR